MSPRFGMRSLALTAASVAGALTIGGTAAHADVPEDQQVLLKGSTTASYFWDDASGRAGDTGLPASGKPMQKGMAASPSWPLLTEGYVVYKGKKMPFFVGDRGPGEPSNRGIMLDLDGKTFAELTGGTFNASTLHVNGNGGMGHIKIEYVITKWGKGPGKKNHPVPFATRAYARVDNNPAKPPQVLAKKKAPATQTVSENAQADEKKATEPAKPAEAAGTAGKTLRVAPAAQVTTSAAAQPVAEGTGGGTAGVVAAVALVAIGGGAVVGRDRLRKLVRR
ncbi:hypothetical protein [Nonomuraea indica]|uniref:hypothetical protein n=1 Tax=Nonomuraea indica TaxID=1581193 RepID=UPI001FEBD360|nr:hypothetical protein [Nonomuraea indica]